MVFSSAAFLFLFLPVTLLLYCPKLFYKNREREIYKKNIVLLAVSLVFYAWGEPLYVLLMMLSIGFNYLIGLDLEMHRDKPKKMKLILVFGILCAITGACVALLIRRLSRRKRR